MRTAAADADRHTPASAQPTTRGRTRGGSTARSRDSGNSRMSDRAGSLRRARACRPALARKACSSTLVGLLTPRLCRLHAFSRRPHAMRVAMASKQPASAPGHSGGAVPDSHRCSLFARRCNRTIGPPGSPRQSTPWGAPVNERGSTADRPPDECQGDATTSTVRSRF